ncbi:putative lipid phosphate phosphatase PPAPDC3 [Trachymyrmex cornetzi]|uniref:Putative lipid phosphate phosphatase PPAPDC3 n=1 Tax=Trachymyrmex cornetzi TaxID=471704 RepID=A0A195DP89_9HYME|nr:putative lipid phosphate phosphatase PPAPDC3 [Trachymyrmex cornetzi]
MHKDSSRAGTIISRRSCSSNVDIPATRRPISRELIRSHKSFDIPGVHHSALRLLGARPPPLIRRSSFPTPQAKKAATSSLCGTPSKGLTRRQSAESEEEIRTVTNTLHHRTQEFMGLSKLSISCHGIPWLAVSLISIWVFNVKSLYQMQTNLLIGLLLDIIVVAVLKAVTRRRRPTTNGDPFSLGPDKYSFPSGHSSRSAFVVYFFFNLWPISLIYSPPLLAWSFSVCMSRLLMRRHYMLDVFGGVLLGIFEGLLIGYFYLEQETCVYLISWITDDKIPGSE